MGEDPIRILLVEDDPEDVAFTREAFADYKVGNWMTVVSHGAAALAHLRDPDLARPDLILLDLNLPGLDGRQVLTAIHADPDLNRIPVVVLTSSPAEEDLLRSQRLGADAYLRKPVDFAGLVQVVRLIEAFYLRVDVISR
jgi:CheY-like chemotaxis protein